MLLGLLVFSNLNEIVCDYDLSKWVTNKWITDNGHVINSGEYLVLSVSIKNLIDHPLCQLLTGLSKIRVLCFIIVQIRFS